jgi:dTDP-glucose pyrophosphorylase
MACIDRNVKGIALVVDHHRRLIGTVTDGDLRRALLKGATLDTPVRRFMGRCSTTVGVEAGRAEVLDLMQARSIEQIPIVDAQGRLIGLHVLREVIGAEERPNMAVIMAGGQGTRLRPVTEQIPKPMIKVAGRPILDRVVLHLVSCGIRHIFISINHLGHVIEKYFCDGSRFGCRIEYLREKEPLGTGGPLSLLKRIPSEPIIAMNGDLVTQPDIAAMLRFHTSGGYMATMAIRRYGHQIPFGCVALKGRRIVRLEEKPIIERPINAGIYILNPRLIRRVPKRLFPITELFGSCLVRGEPIGAFEVEEEWVDVGQREQLKQGLVQ